jgi:arrestin (S-antigen)-like protein
MRPLVMRSRPDLKLYLTPGIVEPGARLRAEAEIVSRSETPIDGVEFHLVGIERRHAGTSMVGNVPVPIYQVITHVDLVGRTPATTLDKGPHRLAVDFDLPRSCPPAYRSAVTDIRYDLTVRVAIPWWPDRSERYVVNVVTPPSQAVGEPGSYCSDGAGPQGKALYLEASLDSAVIDHAGGVRGAVSVANVSHHRVRRIELALVVDERPLDRSSGKHEALRYLVNLHEGPPIEGEAMQFHVKIPEKSTPSFVGSVVEVSWHLEIRAVVALGSDVTLQIPIEVVRRAPDAPISSQNLRRVPPIGRARRALVWAESARRNGLVNDVNEERMTLDLGGGAALAITLEQRKEGGLYYTAAVTWPRLGLDFGVTERRWMDAWTSGEITIDAHGFHDRFTIRGREPAQVLAFLDEAGARALLFFEEAAVGDEGATLVASGTAQSVDDLDAFVTRAISVATMLARGVDRIPPPASMAAFVPAWRAFAGALGGRLSLGDMAIHDATYDQAPLRITTKWTEKDEPHATLLRLPVTLRDDVAAAEANLDPASRALLASLKTQTMDLAIRADAIEATLPAPLADPATIEPILIGLTRLAHHLGGGSTRGPYR